MIADSFDYPRMIREALRRVPQEALTQVYEQGLPEPHHFYLTFRTGDPGVSLSPRLRQEYPEEMTIVLKTQFEELEVDDSGFSVVLFFGGRPERLHVPFAALTAFADPPAAFGLRFEDVDEDEDEAPDPVADEADVPRDEAAQVVSFEEFRRRSSS